MTLAEIKLYKLKWNLLFAYFKLTGKKIQLKKYCGKLIDTAADGNLLIKKKIIAGAPLAVGRLGYNELRTVIECIECKLSGQHSISEETKNLLCNNAGFFPNNDDEIFNFCELMEESFQDIDILGVWNNKMEDLLVKDYMDGASLCELRGLEPYYFDEPWSGALKGKKVLVIHPFAESIISQYQKHRQLFDNKEVLPDFDLKAIKAVQTIAGQKDSRFGTWFDALEYMFDEAMKTDFDIALIGCGAYGLPLAVKIKKAGKQAIHMGGATQILFGIKGKRWDNHPVISQLYNDSWIRPSDMERPKEMNSIENGCYW